MKKVFVLGLCLATSVSVLSLKNTNSNEKNLGAATVVVNHRNLVAYEDSEAGATTSLAKLAAKVWNKSCKELLKTGIGETLSRSVVSTTKESVANVELNDEINSKLKTL